MNTIHPTAIIEEDVILGKGNIIEAYAVIKNGVRLGNNNVVRSFSVLGETPTSPTYGGLYSTLEIGNNNLFASHCVIQKGSGMNAVTRIGNNNNFYNHTTVAYNCDIGNNNYFIAYVGLAGNIKVGNNVTFAANSGAAIGSIQGLSTIEIGDYAYIGAYSKIACSVPPFVMVTGGYLSKIVGPNSFKLTEIYKEYKEDSQDVIDDILNSIAKTTKQSAIQHIEFHANENDSKFAKKLEQFYNNNRSVLKNSRK